MVFFIQEAISEEQVFSSKKGIEYVLNHEKQNFKIYSSKGIGSFFIHLPKGEKSKLDFFYSKGKPFKNIEGFSITHISNGFDLTKELIASGRVLMKEGRLIIHKQDKSIKWNITFIDYFRN